MEEKQTALWSGKSIPETIFRLSWPAILEQFLICMATLVDTAMVGSIGAVATAAVAINISTVWLINGCLTALSVGFSFLVSHAIGEQDKEKTAACVRQSITASFLLGLFLLLVVRLIHQQLPILLGAEPDVIGPAQSYMGILAFGFLPQSMAVVLSAVFRSAGNTRLPLAANLISNCLNMVGNFFLIYPSRTMTLFGKELAFWGAGLGVTGAAISTASSQLILACLLLWLIYHAKTPAKITLRGNYRFHSDHVHTLLHISIPVLLERVTLCLGQIALTATISGLGTVALAAHYLTNQTEGLLYLPAYGFAYSATTLIGQAMGARDRQLTQKFAYSISVIGSITILALCIPVFLLARPIIGLFSSDPAVVDAAVLPLQLAAAFEVFFSYSIIAGGIFRGAGDVKFPLIVSLVGMWGIRIGLVYLVVKILHFSVGGVWLVIGIDSFIRAILCVYRIKGGKWLSSWTM